jgi:RNA polymerase sigma-70 factor (ECF subfamily)
MKETEDSILIQRYRDGDAAALGELVELHRRVLYGYIVNMVQGRDDADEIFQETWMKVIRKIHLYRDKNFGGWLIRIARNSVIDRVRRRRPVSSLDAETAAGTPLIELMAEKRELAASTAAAATDLRQRIEQAVATLPEEQREVFVLRTKAEMPFKEIARLQKTSINTALARMQYALKKLRDELSDQYAEWIEEDRVTA